MRLAERPLATLVICTLTQTFAEPSTRERGRTTRRESSAPEMSGKEEQSRSMQADTVIASLGRNRPNAKVTPIPL